MKRQESDRSPSGAGREPAPGRGLAGLLAPMRANLVRTACDVFILELEPFAAPDAIRAWRRWHERDHAEALVLDRRAANATADAAERAGIAILERFANGAIAVAPDDLGRRLATPGAGGLVSVLIEGPVDRGDADAVENAIHAGGSALSGDVRAVLAVETIGDHAVRLETRTPGDAARFAAEAFTRYLGSVTGRPASDLTAPEPMLVERILERTGKLAVRPIETEIFSTAIDVGISTWPTGEVRPADTSLIYDLHSHTWHGD